jgi:hypothetical protein
VRNAAANVSRRLTVQFVGRAASPLICIDEFSPDPEALVARAAQAAFIDVGSRYPGVRAPAPDEYVRELLAAAGPAIEEHFGAPPEPELDLCAFSLVTLPPGRLLAAQRIPHFDGPETRRIAFLHYLCGLEQGGTAFYRHRATGLEMITPDVSASYRDAVLAELRAEPPAPEYAVGDTRFFERIHAVEAACNRLIVYRGNSLHSGDITARTVLSEDPRRGRLTINGFGWLGGGRALPRLPTR